MLEIVPINVNVSVQTDACLPLTSCLVDIDLASLVLLGFRNNDTQDAMLHRGTDRILVDATREGELSIVFADRPFMNVVLCARLSSFLYTCRLLLLDLSLRVRLGILVLNCWLMRVC